MAAAFFLFFPALGDGVATTPFSPTRASFELFDVSSPTSVAVIAVVAAVVVAAAAVVALSVKTVNGFLGAIRAL